LKCLLSELKLKRIAAQLRLSLDVRMGGGGFKGGDARLLCATHCAAGESFQMSVGAGRAA
jgi:hypothetical protein